MINKTTIEKNEQSCGQTFLYAAGKELEFLCLRMRNGGSVFSILPTRQVPRARVALYLGLRRNCQVIV